jgi:hypothetical protein
MRTSAYVSYQNTSLNYRTSDSAPVVRIQKAAHAKVYCKAAVYIWLHFVSFKYNAV